MPTFLKFEQFEQFTSQQNVKHNMNMCVPNNLFICMPSMEVTVYKMSKHCRNKDNKMNVIDRLIKCKLTKKRRPIVWDAMSFWKLGVQRRRKQYL